MIYTVKYTNEWRIVRMGNSLVLHFHRCWSWLFSPISWEYTHPSDVGVLEHDARCIVSGQYGKLLTRKLKEQVKPVPAAAIGL